MRCFLPANNINKIDLCVAGIEIHLHHLVAHISQKDFNALKNVLYIERSAVSQVLIFNKSVMNQNKSLVITILSLRHDQIMSKNFNT